MEKIKVGDTVKKNQLIATQDSKNIKYNLRIKKNQLYQKYYQDALTGL